MPKMISSRLVKGGFILTAANILTGLLGYAFQVLMGRLFTPTEFALFSAVLALCMFSGAPLGAFFMLVSRQVSKLRSRDNIAELPHLLFGAHKFVFLGGVVFLAGLSLFQTSLMAYIHTDSGFLVWLIGFIVIGGALQQIINSFFQGLQKFELFGSVGFFAVLIKILLSGLLVYIGFGVQGGVVGVALSPIITWLLGLVFLAKLLPKRTEVATKSAEFTIYKVLPILIANVAFVSMTQLDIVLVNYFFDPEQAGLYAAASVLGKAVLYVPSGLVFALFPLVVENHSRNLSSISMLITTLLLTLALCGGASGFYFLFSNQIVQIFYGSAYEGAGGILKWYGLAMLPLSFVMVVEYFLIAQGKTLFAWLFFIIAPFQFFMILNWHEEMWMVLTTMSGCGLIMLLVGLAVLLISDWSKIIKKKA